MTKRHRDAVTGEYVSEEYAMEHPDTTVSEEVPELDDDDPEVGEDGSEDDTVDDDEVGEALTPEDDDDGPEEPTVPPGLADESAD